MAIVVLIPRIDTVVDDGAHQFFLQSVGSLIVARTFRNVNKIGFARWFGPSQN
jgi:hypothetical protein